MAKIEYGVKPDIFKITCHLNQPHSPTSGRGDWKSSLTAPRQPPGGLFEGKSRIPMGPMQQTRLAQCPSPLDSKHFLALVVFESGLRASPVWRVRFPGASDAPSNACRAAESSPICTRERARVALTASSSALRRRRLTLELYAASAQATLSRKPLAFLELPDSGLELLPGHRSSTIKTEQHHPRQHQQEFPTTDGPDLAIRLHPIQNLLTSHPQRHSERSS